MTNRKILVASAVALALSSGQAMSENILRWTSQGDALTLDPHAQNEAPTIAMNGMMYESLVTRDAEMTLQAELAESWESNDNVWTFKLRQGVTYHGGEDFTAEDVAFSIERARQESSDFKEQIASILEVKIVDDYTVELITDGVNPILPNELTSLYMVDKGWAEENDVLTPQDFAGGEESYAARNANGTGPFKLVSRAPDELTVMEANGDWWGKGEFPGNIERLEYRRGRFRT